MKQNMGKGKAKGTVLFTVITVMMVMVVLLMTTLTLTSAAHRRSYYTYFQSQAQYAAQNAIDAVTYSAYTRQDFHDWVVEHVTEDDENTHFINLEFAGSEIQYTSGEPIVECTIERLHPDVKWDEATSALHSRAMWKITATARVGHGRNESEATVSQYLYENFQVAAEDLGLPATNSAGWTVWTPPEEGGEEEYEEGVPLAHSPGTLMFGNKGYANNMVNLGPAYSNLVTLPRGWGRYDDAPGDYNMTIRNNRQRTVGDVIFVNNVTSIVKSHADFQSPREGAVYYGNLTLGNNGYSWLSRVKDTVTNSGNNYYEDNSNYVYIDGVFGTNAAVSLKGEVGARSAYGDEHSGVYDAAENTKRPVNLYCGAIDFSQTANSLRVCGDVTLYNPNLESIWIETDGGTALSKFTEVELYKGWSTVGDAGNTVGGNIYCNNKLLVLGGTKEGKRDGTFIVDGDVIMTNPSSRLIIWNDVHITGKVISAGTVTNNGTVDGGVTQNSGGNDYYTESVESDYPNYSLMPFYNRIDEVFEKYYRWDLQTGNSGTADGYLSSDKMILESRAAGHIWGVQPFAISSTETVYVPFTTPVDPDQHRWVIPEHKYYSPEDGVSMMTSTATLPDYASFTGTLPAYGSDTCPELKTNVSIISHDIDGNEQTDDLGQCYVVTKSCTIDLSEESKYGNNDRIPIFVDPSRSSSMIKIGLKGRSRIDGGINGKYDGSKAFYFIVNNTAYYTGGDYANPEPYADPGDDDDFKAIKAVECEVMLSNDFGAQNPFFCTTGAWTQIWSNELSIVQNPTFPESAYDLEHWSYAADTKYAYELVPNFTVYTRQPSLSMVGNGAMFNCDLVAPLTTLNVGTFNSMSDVTVTYREYSDSNPSVGKSYLWSIGSVMIGNMDTTNDQNALCAYIKGTGLKRKEPSGEPGTHTSNSASQALGENRNAYFNNDHIGY